MAESSGIGKGFAAGKTAQEQVDMLRNLLSPLKGRAIVNADEMAFKNAISNPSSGETSLNLNTDSGARFKKGGSVKRSSASKRADGCAVRGKTRA